MSIEEWLINHVGLRFVITPTRTGWVRNNKWYTTKMLNMCKQDYERTIEREQLQNER